MSETRVPDPEELDLRARIGQCFMVGYVGDEPDAELADMLRRREVGSVILFSRNASEGKAMRSEIAKVRELSPEWPLIALDQEGGAVLRVGEGASDLPGAMALGASGDLELIEAVGRAAGRELLAMGADLNLAPVLDVNRVEANPGIGLRSFGTTPETVAEMGGAWLKGILSSGALCCGKHFPGKGAAEKDAHISMPTVDVPRGELIREDVAPFRMAVQAGVPALMTSHVTYPALDPDESATTSAAAVHLAREELGFEGLLLTDDLQMGAMAEGDTSLEEHALACLAVGHDLLLVCHDRPVHLAMLDHIQGAVESGVLPAARVDEACERVLAAKRRAVAAERGVLEELVEEHRPLMERAHLAGITRHGEAAALDPELPWTLYAPRVEGLVQVEEGTGSCEVLEAALRQKLPDLEVRVYRPRDGQCEEAPAGRHVVFASYNAHLMPPQAALLGRVSEQAASISLVTLRNPFDVRLLPGSRTTLIVNGFRATAQRQAAAVLLGESAPGGAFRFRSEDPFGTLAG